MLSVLLVIFVLAMSVGTPIASAVDASATTSSHQSELLDGVGDGKASEYYPPSPPAPVSPPSRGEAAPDIDASLSLCSSINSYLPSSISSSLCSPPVKDEAPQVVEPVSFTKVAYAFLPNPSSFNIFVLLLVSLFVFSSKARKNMVTYGGVATLCTWYAVRRVVNRKQEQQTRRMSIKMNRTPSPTKRPKSLGLDTVSEDAAMGSGSPAKEKKKLSPFKKMFAKKEQ
jgi:hypothetical protein